jgi:lipopolysaccharide transport system permease protein
MSEIIKNIPVTEIRPGRAWIDLNLRELWVYRELIYFLTQRELKVRYKQTSIGIIWAILQPVLTTIIFTAIFSQFTRFDNTSVPYPVFALVGLLIWLFINTSISSASSIFLTNIPLVSKVYIPRIILPMSVVFACLADLLIGLVILLGMVFWYGIAIAPQIMLAPLFIVLAVVLAIGVGLLFSALSVRFRDIRYALPFVMQIWMFISPVIYPPEILSPNARLIFTFNPLFGILQGFRASVLGGDFDWRAIGISVAITISIVFCSLFVFKKLEEDFADVI